MARETVWPWGQGHRDFCLAYEYMCEWLCVGLYVPEDALLTCCALLWELPAATFELLQGEDHGKEGHCQLQPEYSMKPNLLEPGQASGET